MDAYIIVGYMPEAFKISERSVQAIKKPTSLVRPKKYSSSQILSTKVLVNNCTFLNWKMTLELTIAG